MLIANVKFRAWISPSIDGLSEPTTPPVHNGETVMATRQCRILSQIQDGDWVLIRPTLIERWWGRAVKDGPNLHFVFEDGFRTGYISGDLIPVDDLLIGIELAWREVNQINRKTLHLQRVERFMRLAGHRVRMKQAIGVDEPTEQERLLAAKLLFEECLETISEGLGVSIDVGTSEETLEARKITFEIDRPFDMVATIDGLADVSVVNSRIFGVIGVPDEPILELIDANNLAKFGPGHSFRSDGKLIKPPDHRPPAIVDLLATLP